MLDTQPNIINIYQDRSHHRCDFHIYSYLPGSEVGAVVGRVTLESSNNSKIVLLHVDSTEESWEMMDARNLAVRVEPNMIEANSSQRSICV